MPPANKPAQHNSLLRTFIYGKDKTKKTWWALRAAEAGFNVILLNGDDGADIVRQIPEEARSRIMIVDLVDTVNRAVFAEFMAMFLRDHNSFTWNEITKSFTYNVPASDSALVVNASKLDHNTVLVVDSWTALVKSTMFRYAYEQNIDLTDAAKQEWDGYGFQGRFLNFVLKQMHALKCHLIVIGHHTVHEKRAADGKTIIWAHTQPESSSNNHGATLGKYFNDVLYFSQISSTAWRINTGGDQDRAGGSRLLEPKTYKWDDLPPQILFDKLELPHDMNRPLDEAFKWYAPGEKPEIVKPNLGRTTLDAANAAGISAGVTTAADQTAPKKLLFAKK